MLLLTLTMAGITHAQPVENISHEPDYDAALKALGES